MERVYGLPPRIGTLRGPSLNAGPDGAHVTAPVGTLLTWLTELDDGAVTELLLDGPQRVTSLCGVMKGRAPSFFSGDRQAFTKLRFHAASETFEFFQPIKMRDDPFWFDMTEVMQAGHGGLPGLLEKKLGTRGVHIDPTKYVEVNNRLLRLLSVTDRDLHIEPVTDEGKDIDTVVDIFHHLNSAGTTLSSGDLALARVAAKWPVVREEMDGHVKAWRNHGFHIAIDWLLRCVNAVVNGEVAFQHLHDTLGDEVKDGLQRTFRTLLGSGPSPTSGVARTRSDEH